MATKADATRTRCKRCKQLFLVEIPRKGGAQMIGECSTPLCYALAHYSDDDWRGKADMARVRRAMGIAADNDFDREALRRFP